MCNCKEYLCVKSKKHEILFPTGFKNETLSNWFFQTYFINIFSIFVNGKQVLYMLLTFIIVLH